jgi:hypothetical protein
MLTSAPVSRVSWRVKCLLNALKKGDCFVLTRPKAETTRSLLGATLSPVPALQADGVTPLQIAGECHFTLSRNGIDLEL